MEKLPDSCHSHAEALQSQYASGESKHLPLHSSKPEQQACRCPCTPLPRWYVLRSR